MPRIPEPQITLDRRKKAKRPQEHIMPLEVHR